MPSNVCFRKWREDRKHHGGLHKVSGVVALQPEGWRFNSHHVHSMEVALGKVMNACDCCGVFGGGQETVGAIWQPRSVSLPRGSWGLPRQPITTSV